MKTKLFLCTTLLMLTLFTFAQDVIVTTDSKKIEAKILEVSKYEIKYKDADNLEGPTFILSVNDINSIVYSNGKVVLYNQSTQPVTHEQTNPTSLASLPQVIDNAAIIELTTGEILNVQLTNVTSSSVSYIQNGVLFTIPSSQINNVSFSNGQVKVYNSSGFTSNDNAKEIGVKPLYVSRSGNMYYYDGKAMNESTYYEFLLNNCSEASNLFYRGSVAASVGWILFSIGVGLDFGTLISYLAVGGNSAISAMSLIGLGFEIACIPTLIVGYNKKHRSADVFNTTCAHKNGPQAYWSINASQNGIGIAYNF